eukprot:m.258116 g.258116  ORF g.258116 m.258116 type:complete len:86 (-) comp54575_c0_seq30:923-1180(-)
MPAQTQPNHHRIVLQANAPEQAQPTRATSRFMRLLIRYDTNTIAAICTQQVHKPVSQLQIKNKILHRSIALPCTQPASQPTSKSG